MKKIKFLLLWIVSILWIGSSFASFSINWVLYEDWFYRNSDRWLITIISSWDIATLQDKNLGATEVFDPTSQNVKDSSIPTYYFLGKSWRFWKCSQIWNLYQYWNNFPFDCTTFFNSWYLYSDYTYETPSSTYTWENPYFSSGFYDWRYNNPWLDAWWWVTLTTLAQKWPCPDWYYIPSSWDFWNFNIMLNRFSYNYNSTIVFELLKIPYKYNWVSNNSSRVYRDFFLSSSSKFTVFSYKQWYGVSSPYFQIGFNPVNSEGTFNFPYWSFFAGTLPIPSPSYFGVWLNPVRCFKNTPVLPDNTRVALSWWDTSLLPDPVPEYEPNPDIVSPIDWWIFDYNAYLLEQAILCYMSNWYTGNCDWINYTWFVDQYQHQNPWWSEDNQHWSLTFTEASSVLSNYCINNNIIQYPFCSQLDLYNDAWLTYFYDTWVLLYYILWSWFTVDLSNQWSGQLWPLTCYWKWCENVSQWLPNYIKTWNSSLGYSYSWEYISEDFYDDYISKWFWFTCPYSYSWSYFVIGSDLIDRLWGRDLIVPINCFISAYSAWRKMFFFWDPEYWAYWTWSLITWDTPWHQRLFMFFDIVLSFWLLVVLFKLFNFITWKK